MIGFDLERVAKTVAQNVLTETEYDGKTFQEWIEALKDWRTPVKPERSGHNVTWWYSCGACGAPLDPGDAFCRRCGRAVKWE